MSYNGLILALDPASTMGVAEGVVGEVPRLYSVELKKKDDTDHDTWRRTTRWIARKLHEEEEAGAVSAGLVRVLIEEPVWGIFKARNAASAKYGPIIWGIIVGHTEARGCHIESISVHTVRKHFLGYKPPTGKGKQLVMEACRTKLGWDPPNLDASDAAALWHLGSWRWNPDNTPALSQTLLRGVRRGV